MVGFWLLPTKWRDGHSIPANQLFAYTSIITMVGWIMNYFFLFLSIFQIKLIKWNRMNGKKDYNSKSNCDVSSYWIFMNLKCPVWSANIEIQWTFTMSHLPKNSCKMDEWYIYSPGSRVTSNRKCRQKWMLKKGEKETFLLAASNLFAFNTFFFTLLIIHFKWIYIEYFVAKILIHSSFVNRFRTFKFYEEIEVEAKKTYPKVGKTKERKKRRKRKK